MMRHTAYFFGFLYILGVWGLAPNRMARLGAISNLQAQPPKAAQSYFASFAAAAFIRANNSAFVSRAPNGFLRDPWALCSLCFGAFFPFLGAPAAL